MADDGWQHSVDEPPWWLDVDAYDLPDVDALDEGDLIDGDEMLLDPLSVEETLMAASLVGPGSHAAGLLESLTRLSPTQDEWLTAVQLWEAQEAWLVGQKALAVLGFAGPEPVTMAGFRDDEALVLELALGVGCSEGFAYEQIATARLLSSTLSRTGDLLRAGKLSPSRARIIVGELGHLHTDVAQAVETRVIDTAAQVPTGTLRKTLLKHTKRLDRQAANDRKVADLAEKTPGRRVVFDPDAGDGLVGLYAYLPPVEGLAMRAALKAAAGAFRTADGRCQDEREADALMGMVLGFDPANPGLPVPPKVKVGLLIDVATLMGLRDNDGELLGVGDLPAEVSREIARRGSSWHRLVYDPVTGYLLDGGTEVHDMPALTAFIPLRDRRDRFPGGTRTAPLDLDHTKAFKPRNRRKTNRTDPGPAAEGTTAVPSADALLPPAGTGAAGDTVTPTTQDFATTTEWVEAAIGDLPAVDTRPAETGPSDAESPVLDGDPTATSPVTEAATVATVDSTIITGAASWARGPDCAKAAAPAEGVSADGVVQQQEGGRTCADNLAALSRRHHRAKTFLHFSYRQLGLGVLEWTTPLGRVYRTYPHDYRPESGGADEADDEPP